MTTEQGQKVKGQRHKVMSSGGGKSLEAKISGGSGRSPANIFIPLER